MTSETTDAPDLERAPHVAEAFREAERQAERAGAWLRAGTATALALIVFPLLLHMPEAETHAAERTRVALVTFAGFAALAALAFFGTRRGRHRPWIGWALAAGDAVMLWIAAMLALHGSDVPHNYLLALPVAWIVPLLLAVGATRHDPRLAGFAVLSLLLALVLVMARHDWLSEGDPPPAALAHLFDAQPNVIRLGIIAMTGLALVFAVRRSRRLVLRVIAETTRIANLTRYLPPEAADWLAAQGDAARRGTRRAVAILFVDLRGFTAFSESMDPAATSAFLTEYRARVASCVRAAGGLVDKFIGDGVMALFGALEDEPDAAHRALAAVRATVASLDALSREREAAGEPAVRFAVGAHFGEVYCGAIGDERRLEFTVLGDPVNVAARLETLCKQLDRRAVVSDALMTAAGADAAGWERLDEQALRGRAQALTVWAR